MLLFFLAIPKGQKLTQLMQTLNLFSIQKKVTGKSF